MKRAILVLLALCALSAGQGKSAVAVYMSGVEPKGALGAHEIMGEELVKAISRSDRFSAINRTDAVLKLLAKEHTYTRNGAVTKDGIMAIGQQLGVQYLCTVKITDVKGGSFYVAVQLVDVVSAETIHSATEESSLNNGREMLNVARQIALELTGVDLRTGTAVQPVQEARPAPRIQPPPPPVQETRPVQPPAPPPVQEARPVQTPQPPMSPKDAAKAAYEAYNRGETAAIQNNNYDKAIEEYTEAIRLDPKWRGDYGSTYYSARGNAYWHKDDKDNAILDYTEAIKIDPDNQGHYFHRGLMYSGKDYNKAIADYTEAIRLAKMEGKTLSLGVYYSGRGDCYKSLRNYAQAVADYEESLRLDPKNKRVKESLKEAKRLMK